MIMNENCFARRKGSRCSALWRCFCNGNYPFCPFYKPDWKAEHDRKLAFGRIASLPIEKQQEIAERYYHGDMPWIDPQNRL